MVSPKRNRDGGAKRKLRLSIALAESAVTRPLLDGLVSPEGIELIPSVLHGSEIFWRQLRFGDFDASEMSLSSLLIATARGDNRWAAIPAFTMRRFFHTGILVRSDAGIDSPTDLVGKRVGVPEYQQTSAIWSRGILQDQFGVAPQTIDWYMERGLDRSHGHATGFVPPPGVRLHQIAANSDIGQMLLEGSLDASLLYLNEKNLVDRSSVNVEQSGKVRRLFADPLAEGRRYHRATGLYPINHVLVVRRSLLEQHGWIALNLYSAFVAAKEAVRSAAGSVIAACVETGQLSDECAAALKADPMPYGFRCARGELETVARYVHQQGLTDRQVRLDEVFAESTLDL